MPLSLDFIENNIKFEYISPVVFLDFEKSITIAKLYYAKYFELLYFDT